MTDTHNIPMLEDDLHELSPKCICHPARSYDEATDLVTWIHLPLRNDRLIDQLNIAI